MKTETLLHAKHGEITTTEDLIETQITRPLNNRELEEKIDSLCEVLKKTVVAIAGELGFSHTVDLISNIEEIQKDLK